MSSSEMKSPQSLIEWALYYVRRGWPVFPLHARAKTPLTVKGFKDASTDESTVRAWWSRWPDANIGVPTGGRSGLAVLDVDQPGGDNSLTPYLDKHGALPETPQSITGGGGRQYFFTFEEGFRNSAGHFGVNLDTRGEGGYVVVPPSIHPSGESYQWELSSHPDDTPLAPLPVWLRPGAAPLTGIFTPGEGPGNLGGTFDATAIHTKATGVPVPPGGRNMAAASLAGQYLAAGDSVQSVVTKLRIWNAANPTPLPDGEIESVAASVALTHQRRNPGAAVRIADATEEVDVGDVTITPAPIAFPPSLLAPPGFVGEIVQWITGTAYKPQPILALANTLAFFGAVVGRKVQTPTRLRTNLYCLGVGESGCGKDHSRKAIKAICAAAGLADQLLGGEDISSDSAILGAVHEHPSILFQFDEIGHMIAAANSRYAQSHQRAIAPLLTKLFSSANTIYLGKEYAGRKDKRRDIDQPNVCIYGTTVPGRLYEGLTPGEISDGFLGRMLVFQSDAADPHPVDAPWQEPPEGIIQMVQAWVGRTDLGTARGNIAALTTHVPLTVPYEDEARARLKAFEVACRKHKEAARRDNGLDVLWSRAMEHAGKVALTIACGCEYATPIISGDVMAWSIDLVEYLTRALIETVGDSVAGSDFERDLLYVKRQVTSAGADGITHSALVRKTRRLNPRARNDILGELIQSGTIVKREVKPQRGPMTIVYVVRKTIPENNCSPDKTGDAA